MLRLAGPCSCLQFIVGRSIQHRHSNVTSTSTLLPSLQQLRLAPFFSSTRIRTGYPRAIHLFFLTQLGPSTSDWNAHADLLDHPPSCGTSQGCRHCVCLICSVQPANSADATAESADTTADTAARCADTATAAGIPTKHRPVPHRRWAYSLPPAHPLARPVLAVHAVPGLNSPYSDPLYPSNHWPYSQTRTAFWAL